MSRDRERLAKEFNRLEQAAQAARLHFIEGRKADDVAKTLNVSRVNFFALLNLARNQGMIHAELPDDYLTYLKVGNSPTLERQLAAKFSQLDLQATVWELPVQVSGEEDYDFKWDYYLHGFLARMAASDFRSLLRRDDNIGVGGGVEMRQFAQFYEKLSFLDKSAQIISLCGGVHRYELPDGKRMDVSAMSAAYYLSSLISFDENGKWNQPVLNSGTAFLRKKGDYPETKIPDIAVIGLGNVSPRLKHFMVTDRFYGRGFSPEVRSLLIDLTHEVEDFSGIKDEESGGYYYPLLEALNSIFVIRPPENLEPVMKGMAERLGGIALELNQYANGMRRENFQKIPARLVIAGGLHKTFQIQHAINIGLVNRLVTDALTAEALLKL